jgi:hypothetical protein
VLCTVLCIACSHSAAHVLNLLHSVPRWALEVLLGKSPGALTFESLTTSLPHYLTTSLPHYLTTHPLQIASQRQEILELKRRVRHTTRGTPHYSCASRYTTLLVCLEVRHTTRVPRAPGSTSAASLCSREPGSTSAASLCSREHNQAIFVLPGAQSSSICAPSHCAPGNINERHLCSREHNEREHNEREHNEREMLHCTMRGRCFIAP